MAGAAIEQAAYYGAFDRMSDILQDLMVPTAEQAEAFATMMHVGAPAGEAIRYFLPDSEDWTHASIAALTERWLRNARVRAAAKRLMGRPWEEMSPEERIKHSLDKHYGELAYLLFSRNYATLEGADKTKADTARGVLEAKLAGLAGQLDPFQRFWEDFKAGKVELKGGAGAKKAAPSDPPILVIPATN